MVPRHIRGTPSGSVVLSDGSVLRYVMSQRQADTQNTKSNTYEATSLEQQELSQKVHVMIALQGWYMHPGIPLEIQETMTFLTSGFFGRTHTSACSRGFKLHVGMLIIVIHSKSRKLQRLGALTHFS